MGRAKTITDQEYSLAKRKRDEWRATLHALNAAPVKNRDLVYTKRKIWQLGGLMRDGIEQDQVRNGAMIPAYLR